MSSGVRLWSSGLEWSPVGTPLTPEVPNGRPTDWGNFFPVPNVNIGLINESILDEYNSPNTQTVVIPDGTDLTNKIVYGDTRYTANGGVYNEGVFGENILFAGGYQAPTSDSAVIQSISARTGSNPILHFTDFEIRPQFPHAYRMGIRGVQHNFQRFYIHSCTDGIRIGNSTSVNSGNADCTYQGGYITDLYYTRPDPQHGASGSHCDGIQIEGSKNFLIEGIFFEGKLKLAPGTTVADGRPDGSWGGSVVVWQDNTGNPTDNTGIFRKNWLKGGSAMMYLHTGVTGQIVGNRYSQECWSQYWIRKFNGAQTFLGLDGAGGNDGNVWWDGASAGVELSAGRYYPNGIEYM